MESTRQEELNNSITKHPVRFKASSAYRWMECHGSVGYEALYPEPESSVYADEGSAAHYILEKVLSGDNNLDDFITIHKEVEIGRDKQKKIVKITKEMLDSVEIAINFIKAEFNHKKDVVLKFEKEISLYEDTRSFVDILGYDKKTKELFIIDYKHGAGINVSAVENWQLLYYASAVVKNIGLDNIKQFHLIIIQPRVRHGDRIKRWSLGVEEFDRYMIRLKESKNIAFDKSNEIYKKKKAIKEYLKAGDHCQFCAAKKDCEVFNSKMPIVDFTKHHDYLPMDTKISILNNKSAIKKYLDEVETKLLEQLKAGKKVDGYKLVYKRQNLKLIKDTEAINEVLQSKPDAWRPKTISELKAILDFKEFQSITEMPLEKELTIAKTSDSRDAVSLDETIFADPVDDDFYNDVKK